MKKLAMIAVWTMLACLALGTAQKPDLLFVEGEKHELHSNPLEDYFEAHPERRPQGKVMSSNLWRGYVAVFEIRKGELLIRDVKVQVPSWWSKYDVSERSVLKSLFPSRESRRVEWFSGILILPMGTVQNYVHMGYASVYEKYRLLYLQRGAVKASIVFSADDYLTYKRLQFEQFRRSDRFRLTREHHKKDYPDSTEKEFEEFMFDFDSQFPRDTIINFKEFRPNQALQHNDPSCHVSCLRTPRASRGRG